MPDKNLLVEMAVPECGYHTHKTKAIGAIGYWTNWLERWNKAETFEEMLGLLHCGFSVSLEKEFYDKECSEADRLKFYFTIAEGWSDKSILRLSNNKQEYFLGYGSNGRIYKSQSELWQIVAQKAFGMLALNLFSKMPFDGDGYHGYRLRWVDVVSDDLFPTIQSFFRVVKDEYSEGVVMVNGQPSYKDSSHSWEACVKFLLEFTKFIWSWDVYTPGWASEREKEEYAKLRSNIGEAKLLMIEVLPFLGRLDVLDEWVPLDEACVAKLKEIAMRTELGYGNKVQTLDQACFAGSKVAWLLKKCELVSHEKAKLEKIREAEAVAREAAERLKNLKRKK